MDALNKKFIPLVVTDEPSRKANYKISAMRVLYELHSLKQRRAFMILRAEIEEGNRVKVENEVGFLKNHILKLKFNNLSKVRKLREKISDLKVQVTSITKGIPISHWDVLASRYSMSSLYANI